MNDNIIELKPKNSKETASINIQQYKKSILILKALQHKLRLKMMQYVSVNQPVTVTQLYTHFKLEQSATSQHLAILRRAGVVNIEREGKFIYYSVNVKKVNEINGFINTLLDN